MLKNILIAFGVIIIGIFIYAALQPSQMIIAREITINAPPEAIFPYINNTSKANDWMPWKEQDPGAQISSSGPEEGVGAKSSWVSEGPMGHGEALVIESVPNQSVKTQLTYTKPMQMAQVAEVSLLPSPQGTVVRWAVSGDSPFIARLMCVFMNMEKVVGAQFDKGLNKLKFTVESKK